MCSSDLPNTIAGIALDMKASAPRTMQNPVAWAAAIQAGEYQSLQLMIFRLLKVIFGHAAYAGYFGYFIGLALIRPPAYRWKILGIGLGSAALVHMAWDTFGRFGLFGHGLVILVIYIGFAAVIMKARELSPNRSQLLPSQLLDRFSTVRTNTVEPVSHEQPVVQSPMQTKAQTSSTWGDAGSVLVIHLGTSAVAATVGARILASQTPGLQDAKGDGAVGVVEANPNDATILGLKNLSTSVWRVTTGAGEVRELAPGRAIRITRGTRVQLGTINAEFR